AGGGVPAALTSGAVATATYLAARSMIRDFGIPRPKIGVLALNPHAGEQGQFGDEEARVIRPGMDAAAARLAADGLDAVLHGPLVPDAAYRAGPNAANIHHAYVAMYHCQGRIPVTLIHFADAVNVTLGLPLVRTSPDHGVAYDIAGTGRIRHQSFFSALILAKKLATNLVR